MHCFWGTESLHPNRCREDLSAIFLDEEPPCQWWWRRLANRMCLLAAGFIRPWVKRVGQKATRLWVHRLTWEQREIKKKQKEAKEAKEAEEEKEAKEADRI